MLLLIQYASMAERVNLYKGTPFRSPLRQEDSFRWAGKPSNNVLVLENNPDTVVRASFPDHYTNDKSDFWHEEQLNNRVILNNLRSLYGILVPNFHIVVGGERQFYIVTERVHGPNLHDKSFKPEEKNDAKEKLGTFYSSLTQYIIDTCNSGGWMICDLVGAEAGTSGNKQWVYGRRKNDTEDQVWLVDLGPGVEYYEPQTGLFFQKQLPYLFEMILESEGKLGCKFREARRKLLDYMAEAQSRFPHPDWRAQEIESFFRKIRILKQDK